MDEPRGGLRGFLFCGKGNRAQWTHVAERGRERIASVGQGVDCEIAFAREDYGEEAAVGRNVEFANGEAVEERLRSRLHDGDGIAGFLRGQFGNADPDDIAGFSFDGAFEHDAIFVGGPMENAEAYAQANEAIGSGEIANFQHFLVDEIRDLFAARRNGEPACIAIECGDFFVVLRKKLEALKARRAGLRAVLLDGDGGIGARDAVGVDEGAAFEGQAGGSGGDIGVAEREEHVRLDGFFKIDDGGVVQEPGGVEAVLD